MEIIDIEQGSVEWLKLRYGIATASEFSKMITSEGKRSTSFTKYAMKLAGELLVDEVEESYMTASMERGTELEPYAIEAYTEHTLTNVEPIGFMMCEGYGCSPDGVVGTDGIIEIKCPSQATHTEYLYNNKLPTKYVQQVQGCLFVSGRNWCDFVSFNPNFKDGYKLFIVRVYRDEKFINELKSAIKSTLSIRDAYLKQIVIDNK
jgi:hypothetical protein